MDTIKVLAIYTEWATNEHRKKNNAYGGVGYYRVVKPAEYYGKDYKIKVDVVGKDLEEFGDTPEEIWKKVYKEYDVVYPRHVDNPNAGCAMLALARHFKKKVIMDLDDNYLAIRPSSPAYEDYKPGSGRKAITGAIISLVDGVTVSTDPLKKAFSRLNKEIKVLPNCNDLKDWNFKRKVWNDDKIRIGWAGSTTHDEDLEMIVEAVDEILTKNPKAVFEILGGLGGDKIKWFKDKFKNKDRIEVFFGTPSWDGYPELLNSMGWDIGIAPLADNPFTICKSHIKWMEYAMCGYPCIASKTYPYYKDIQGVKTIQHGKTGLLANNKKEWIDNLQKLIDNKNLRSEIADNAYKYIKDNWQWEQHSQKWAEAIEYFYKLPLKKD